MLDASFSQACLEGFTTATLRFHTHDITTTPFDDGKKGLDPF